MSETALLTQEAGTGREPDQARWLSGVLLMSFASLLLELALTRVFSVVLFYHFAFLAISIALLGLGAGGVFAYLWKDWLARWSTRALGTRVALVNGAVMLAVLEIDLHVPVALELTGTNFLRLSILYLASAVPFFLTGLFFSLLFSRRSGRIAQLYAADLSGASLACLAVVPLLNLVGGPSTIVLAAAAMAMSAAVWAEGKRLRTAGIAVALALAALAGVNYSGRLMDIVYAKGMRRDRPWVLFARWNAISRVEVDDQGGSKVIVIDADASTHIMGADPHELTPEWRANLLSAPASAANVLRPRGAYAIIGPGGGVDVLRALAAGSPNVTGIEINPIIANDVMRERFAEYSHHLYQRPEVRIHVSDGRSWIRNSREQYDVLQMTLVDTWASTAAGAFALSENNLYTLEAFREYFAHLKPGGLLAITRWEFAQPREAMRVVSVGMEALRQSGITAGLDRHFMVVSDGPLDRSGKAVAVLAKKSPFAAEEEEAIRAHLRAFPNLALLYSPSMNETRGALPAGAEPFHRLLRSGDPRQFARAYAYNVAPVTDDSPFFFFNLKPEQVWSTRASQGFDWKVNLGVVVLGMVLVISTIAVLAFLVLPLALRRAATRTRMTDAVRLVYFVAVGLGYILVEIAFIQRFVLFLGHPVYALTVVVFLMLLSSGAGSFVSRRWLSDEQRVRALLLAIAGMLALVLWAVPPLLRSFVGLPLAAKLLMSAGLLVPPGFLMGMPFPTGLRALARTPDRNGDNLIEWAWAMNAASSVLGSVLAMVIAIQFGLTVTLACGALAYLVASAFVPRLARQ